MVLTIDGRGDLRMPPQKSEQVQPTPASNLSAPCLFPCPCCDSRMEEDYAAADYSQRLPRIRVDVCFKRGGGSISTFKSRLKPGRSGYSHRSTAGERVGTGACAGFSLGGQRQWFRMVNALRQ